jgi:hypothetical protein
MLFVKIMLSDEVILSKNKLTFRRHDVIHNHFVIR